MPLEESRVGADAILHLNAPPSAMRQLDRRPGDPYLRKVRFEEEDLVLQRRLHASVSIDHSQRVVAHLRRVGSYRRA